VVYCPHPEWLFWNWTVWAGRYYDACINVAAALSKVVVTPNFFEERAKSIKMNPTETNALRDIDTTRKLEKQNQVLCHPDDLPVNVRVYCTENGIPMERLAKHHKNGFSISQMIHDFIQARQPKKAAWNKGIRMPRNIPHRLPVQQDESENITPINTPSPALLQDIKILPNITRSKNPIVTTAEIHVGREIALECVRCGVSPRVKPVDRKPVFVTISEAKGRYIAQRQACGTAACNPVGRKGQVDQFMVPRDRTIPFIRSDNLSKIKIPNEGNTGGLLAL
jgi:hypothetical protein